MKDIKQSDGEGEKKRKEKEERKENEEKKGRGGKPGVEEKEKKGLQFPVFRLSEVVTPRIKVGLLDESYK